MYHSSAPGGSRPSWLPCAGDYCEIITRKRNGGSGGSRRGKATIERGKNSAECVSVFASRRSLLAQQLRHCWIKPNEGSPHKTQNTQIRSPTKRLKVARELSRSLRKLLFLSISFSCLAYFVHCVAVAFFSSFGRRTIDDVAFTSNSLNCEQYRAAICCSLAGAWAQQQTKNKTENRNIRNFVFATSQRSGTLKTQRNCE